MQTTTGGVLGTIAFIIIIVIVVVFLFWYFKPGLFKRLDSEGFPINKKIGDIFIKEGVTYKWDGNVWVVQSPVNGGK